MNKVYIGYDESNNNSIPEFEVFVYTQNNNYVREIKSKHDFLIKGKERNEEFKDIITEIDNKLSFKYCVLFYEDIVKLNDFEPNQSLKLKKGVFLYSFLKTMNFQNEIEILIDGYIGNDKQCEEIYRFLKFYFPNVNVEFVGGKGDVRFPIINFADRLAYQFFKNYKMLGNESFKSKQSLINLNYQNRFYLKVDEFCKLFNEFRKIKNK